MLFLVRLINTIQEQHAAAFIQQVYQSVWYESTEDPTIGLLCWSRHSFCRACAHKKLFSSLYMIVLLVQEIWTFYPCGHCGAQHGHWKFSIRMLCISVSVPSIPSPSQPVAHIYQSCPPAGSYKRCRVRKCFSDISSTNCYLLGHRLAHWVELASHAQRLCLRRSGPGFESRPGAL